MSYVKYDKPFRTPSDIINDLQNKNLNISNVPNAVKTLSFINYYRFKIYLYPLIDQSTGTFPVGADFDDALDIYRFDDELRDLLFSTIGRLEIKLRSRLDQVVTQHTNDPFWYLDDTLFDIYKINGLRSTLSATFIKARDEFALHYKSKYFNDKHNDYKALPPFWMIAELMTFGNVLSIYGTIKKDSFQITARQNELDDLAMEFGARNLKRLNSWLKLIRDIRNRCAHHSRTWNCNYREPEGIRQLLAPSFPPSHPNRIYLFFALLHLMSKSLQLDNNVRQTLLDLITKYPVMNRHLQSAGFPVNWHNDSFWN